MIARLRSLLLSVNSSYWFFPALFTLIAIVLSVVTIYLDRNGTSAWLVRSRLIHPSEAEGARVLLTVIAGSMIGVASTVFSITIAAVAYASGNYGPRLLTNFMQDRGNQLSLGTFIATFTYSLLVLRTVQSSDGSEFTPQLSVLIAMALAMISVAVLVYFLHHIPASIRINTVLEGIGSKLIRDIKNRYPDSAEERDPREQTPGEMVSATATGYVKIIDFDGLNSAAEKHAATIALKVRTGDFIHPDTPLLEVAGAEVTDGMNAELQRCFGLGATRTAKQDLEFLIDELSEIALRALSPGINDPFTAIAAMQWSGAAIAELGRRDLDRGPEQEDYNWDRVQPLSDDYAHYLNRSFGVMRSAVATSPSAALKFLDTLHGASFSSRSAKRLKLLNVEGERLMEQARVDLAGPSLEELEQRYADFRRKMIAQLG